MDNPVSQGSMPSPYSRCYAIAARLDAGESRDALMEEYGYSAVWYTVRRYRPHLRPKPTPPTRPDIPDEPEQWRTVPGKPDTIEVSTMGRVRRKRRGSFYICDIKPGRLGYKRVTVNGANTSVHRMVAMAFLGLPSDAGLVVRHLNHTPSDNRLSNLAWGTVQDNVYDRSAAGCCGDDVDRARRLADVRDKLREFRMSRAEAGRILGVGAQSVHSLMVGKTFRELRYAVPTIQRDRLLAFVKERADSGDEQARALLKTYDLV